ncbi:MAG: gliding motility-associated protein GldE, partial [Sediminibacterium sp.]
MDDHSVMGLFFGQSFFGAIQPQGTTVLVLILVVLLFLSFVLAGAEVAFFSLTFKDINILKSKQQSAYKR